MTEELKTLKDLEILKITLIENGNEILMGSAVDLIKLKQEAIKWVKAFDGPNTPIGPQGFMQTKSVQKAFCEFFNITEEDLNAV